MPGINIHLRDDIYKRLMKEQNRSRLISSLLRRHYRMEGDEHG